MNIKLAVAVLVGIAAILAGVYFLINKESTTERIGSENEEVSSVSGEFREIVRSGKAFECTLAYDDGINASSGVVYITAGAERIRGDIDVIRSPAGALEVHIVRDGGFNYVWSSIMSSGVKTVVEDKETLFEQSENSPIDPNTTKFDCRSWKVDESKFSLPDDVEFQDMSDMVPSEYSAPQDAASIKETQCGMCAKVTDQNAAAQCRAAFGCE